MFAFAERINKPVNDENIIILYQDDNDIIRVSVRFADEDFLSRRVMRLRICRK